MEKEELENEKLEQEERERQIRELKEKALERRQKRDRMFFLAAVVASALLMIFLVANAPSGAEVTIINHAQKMGLTLEDYHESLIGLLERNPETKEFVLKYPFRQEQEIDLSDIDLTRGVPLLIQWDPRWGYMEYGSDMVGVSGSAPVCLAMVGYYLTEDTKFYPDKVAEFAMAHDYDAAGYGPAWTLISLGAEDLGLSVKELPREEKKIADYLRSGAPIIAAMGPGDFTDTSHFIVLTGYADGTLSVNDPGSYVNSKVRWEFDDIKDQIRALWVIRKDAEE